ncbi:tyrosinase central domain-containing protein [Paracoccidioides lutzii Pb01]|uniref:Tyrosinase central domain-containing protein n=1 Tax=Paracoccidioides lutzii (strain ATCC MYA-826 / Pb01) TaxID=502779 RepID=C1GPY5_PARBA|nr:tyrosinase central domain-containing protein [Paracoccidioides lutzii Pb01]EEH36257.2 tyrosinase central domain-containing protein [Paracoccidioides lutzii Pb01]
MRLGIVCVALVSAYLPVQTVASEVDDLAAQGLEIRRAYDAEIGGERTCDIENTAVRREWNTLTADEKKEYINAVLCLQKLESIWPQSEVPGVRSRFDDFVALHIQQARLVHFTASFLGWHRYYLWTYEEALRNECGYTGHHPYWNWAEYAEDPVSNPMFDGSETSLSGNGEATDHGNVTIVPGLIVPSGTGGGCVISGPFASMSVNLGPITPIMPDLQPNGNGLSYNPRCLRRDISSIISKRFTKTSDIVELITTKNDILSFQNFMQADPVTDFIGVHGGGHFITSGDPGGDFYISPGDPVFYLHHSQIDRIWWIWQNLDPANRLHAVAGGTEMYNASSRNGTADDLVDLGYLGDECRLGDLLSATGGPFCYIYQ